MQHLLLEMTNDPPQVRSRPIRIYITTTNIYTTFATCPEFVSIYISLLCHLPMIDIVLNYSIKISKNLTIILVRPIFDLYKIILDILSISLIYSNFLTFLHISNNVFRVVS